jgi:hypothetical protein
MTTVYNVEEVRTGFAIVEDEISSCTIASSICLHRIPQSYLILGTYLMRCVYRHILRIMPTSFAAMSTKKYYLENTASFILTGSYWVEGSILLLALLFEDWQLRWAKCQQRTKFITQCEVVPAASFQARILLSIKWKEVTVMY